MQDEVLARGIPIATVISIREFSSGPSKVFERVRTDGPALVLRKNVPIAVIMKMEDYTYLADRADALQQADRMK